MRATWLTSLLAGILLGTVGGLAELYEDALLLGLFVGLFFVTTPTLVFGLSLFRELREEQKARGLDWMHPLSEWKDLRRFCFPLWGRMLVWFIAVAICVCAIVIPNKP
jgi:hypothetical protein